MCLHPFLDRGKLRQKEHYCQGEKTENASDGRAVREQAGRGGPSCSYIIFAFRLKLKIISTPDAVKCLGSLLPGILSMPRSSFN